MGNFIYFRANPKPSRLMRNMLRYKGDVSEGTKYEIVATRYILGRKVVFYRNGLRLIDGLNLTDQEMHDSEILRFAHASLLVGAPVGDKRMCCVDATVNPVKVWLYDIPLKSFVKKSIGLVSGREVDPEFLLNEPVKKVLETQNERNGRLFRDQFISTHLQDQ